ncbi:MAG: mechanosensitive ion channel [Deltaproteobacteria bacterium]|nr:mechanosensitive ion channel [Deltaproteobacteria bacterium]MBW2518463.1 mechanosensitive ion channel [Deltaproteobacteria bacterium]
MTLRARTIMVFMLVTLIANTTLAAEQKDAAQEKSTPAIAISEKIGDTMAKEATRVKEDIERQARSLFERKPLGWNWNTIDYLYKWVLGLPLQIPEIVKHILEQSRVLGFAGSLIMLTFIIAVLYSLLGRDRVLAKIEAGVQPLRAKIPEVSYPYFISALKVVVAALIPLILLGAFALINAMITYKAAWFQLAGRLLVLWAIGALLISLLRESLTRDLFQATARYGKKVFNLARLAALYVILGIAIFWGAEVFPIRTDVLALLKFAVSLSIVIVLFLLLLRKKALLSFFPELPYRSYQGYIRMLNRYYYPLIFLSFLLSLLWCAGYKALGEVLLGKIWSAVGVYLLITLIYHVLRGVLQNWQAKLDHSDESAQFLARSFKALLLYATVAASVIIILEIFGLMNPLQRLLSFPILKLGETQVTLWIIVKAAFILTAFIYASRLLQAALDYKIYPSIGVDPGLGYALNTFFKYVTLTLGFLISLKIVGLDLRFLLVFAGAAGIGIGLGLQNMAANVFSGFSIIFGRKIRKGDWIEVGDTLGVVTDIFLRATNVRDRDNIEYLIPNSNLMSNIIVNYSLSSPMIRIELPVGVSYAADPQKVQEILVTVAEQEPMVAKYRSPEVRFTAYGDNSINFELLIWIDVRRTARRAVRSALYFKIFEELKKAGIEIPFPQRDIHIRSQVGPGLPGATEKSAAEEE